MNDVRLCIGCGAKITACFGFGLTRDFFKGIMPREHCGKCVGWMELNPDIARLYLLWLPER